MSAYDTEEKRAKHAARQRAWREENPARWKAIAGPSRAKWKANNPDEHRQAQKNHRYTVRQEIIDLLGGAKCVHCGYDADWRALQIDHIHSDGRVDRNRVTHNIGTLWSFRRKLRDPENLAFAKTRYQVLCSNCNRIKMYEKNEFAGQLAAVPQARHMRRSGNRIKTRQFTKISDGFEP